MTTDLTTCIVLIVDDTESNLDILVETLGNDYDLRVAMDGQAALESVAADYPDLILLDIMMPAMDGYQVCERLKADPHTDSIPIIFITAMGNNQDEARGLALGAVDYIAKPFNPELVKARVKVHLELKRYQDSLEQLVEQRTREVMLTQAVMIESLATLAEYRDPETGGHIKRTQNYVKALATHLREHPDFKAALNDEYIELLYRSAPLHDMGKVGVPDHILLKPGKLTDEEFDEMRRHTVYGYEALRMTEQKLGENHFLRCAKEIAYTHHEKWNGKGYPRGLSGTEIPIPGRLMALADVYDALISKRVYKEPMSHETAAKIIIDDRGQHFDPNVVDAFIELQETFRKIALTYSDSEEEREVLGGDAPAKTGDIEKILLVEDNSINLEIMQSQISSLGYQVETAGNGKDALERYLSSNYDFVITDLDMPIMTGYELTAEIRRNSELNKASVPILAITASDFDMTKERAEALGFNGYMLKPFETAALKQKLQNILSHPRP